MYIAVDRDKKITILKEGYKPKNRGSHVPAAKTPEDATKAWKQYYSGNPVILKVVNADGGDYNNGGYLYATGGSAAYRVTLQGGGYHIQTNHLPAGYLRQYSTTTETGAEKVEKAETAPEAIVSGYFCIPFEGWESYSREKLDKIQGVPNQKNAREIAKKKHRGVRLFKTIHRGKPPVYCWRNSSAKYWYFSSKEPYAWEARGT